MGEAVSLECSEDLERWSPQAVCNVCFALSRADGCTKAFQNFGVHAAQAAMRNSHEYQWQDLSSLATALRHLDLHGSPEVHLFLTWLLVGACQRTRAIETRPLLNIATAACQILGSSTPLQQLIDLMRSDLAQRKLNEMDRNQWRQLQTRAAEAEGPRLTVSLANCLL